MIKTFSHLKEFGREAVKAYFQAHALDDFDRARIALIRGDIRPPTLTTEDFDRICSNLGLSYKALSEIIGVSDQCLMRYRKKNDFPRSVAYLMRLLETKKDGYFSLFSSVSQDLYIPSREEGIVRHHDEAELEKRLLEEKLKNPFQSSGASLEVLNAKEGFTQSGRELRIAGTRSKDRD